MLLIFSQIRTRVVYLYIKKKLEFVTQHEPSSSRSKTQTELRSGEKERKAYYTLKDNPTVRPHWKSKSLLVDAEC